MLTLQFGQCGNQIGSKLFSKITEDLKEKRSNESSSHEFTESSRAKWFQGTSKSGSLYARAVLIDTEKKVINKIINEKYDNWCYRSSNILSTDHSSGSANNWAYGFIKKGPEFEDSVHDAVRFELELSDKFESFLCLSGCAGGTGSGLGSFIIQSLRDEYPKKSILSTVLLPFESGEIATQNYNILLSLAKIIDSADMLIVMENHKLHDQVNKLTNLDPFSFPNDINEIACQQLLSVLQTANDVDNNLFNNNVDYIVSKLIPHPVYKFTSIETIPLMITPSNNTFLTDKSFNVQKDYINWQAQFKYLRRNLLSGNKSRSLTNILLTRGVNSEKVYKNNSTSNKLMCNQQDNFYNCDELTKNDIYAELHWLANYDKLKHFHQNRPFLNYHKFSSVITNNSSINKTLDFIVSKAWNSYTYGAFLHQYKKFEMEDDDFLRAFSKIEGVISSYKELERHG